ncbi:MAG: YCF48-related protein [Bacteroidales bacterium]|nr:YCF48-related protein [Bacteroidales bacterium]
MKKTILLFFLLTFYSISFSQDEWTYIHPNPTLNQLADIHFNSENEGWIVGPDGLIMYTQDGGVNWITQHSNPAESFFSIFFIDDNEGWVVGWKKIYHTINKGATWEEQENPDIIYSGSLMDVFFLNHDIGWIVGSNKTIFKTTDGGENWTKIMFSLGSNELSLLSVNFLSELYGCAVGTNYNPGDGLIMVTHDGGLTWTETIISPPESAGFQRVLIQDSLVGWATGWSPAYGIVSLYKTIDGGSTWNVSGQHGGYITDIHFFNENNGIFVNGDIINLTFDGGETWDSIVQTGAIGSLTKLSCRGEQDIVATGNWGSIAKSFDSGSTWENVSSGMKASIYNIGFFNSMDGLALGLIGNTRYFVRTSDGGYTWVNDTIIPNGEFYMMRIAGSSGYLLNTNSQMMKTNDAGENWELLDIYPNHDLYKDFQFIDENNGFMCGNLGILTKTTNGGLTWENKSLQAENSFTSLFFINENLGWMIDNNGKTILKTQNGGDSWTTVSLTLQNDFQPIDVFFVNESKGFVATEEGMLFSTTDGGETWEEFYMFPYSGIHTGINFVSESEGWYRGGSSIYHTRDGGHSWTSKQTFFQYILIEDMFFLDSHQGWLGGSHGLVATYMMPDDINENNQELSPLIIFPNPAREIMEVQLQDKSDEITDIQIFNMQGQQVIHHINLPGSNFTTIDVSILKRGTHIICVTSIHSKNLLKFIVK